jgi:outer membrane protein assembly factor BamB
MAVATVAAAVAVAVFALRDLNADVHRGHEVEFEPLATPPHHAGDSWRMPRGDLAHTGRSVAALRPPYRTRWVFGQRVLMELPPVVAGGRVYVHRFDGQTFALDADNGAVVWKRRVGRLSATTPAYWRDRLFVASLSKQVVALRARDGAVLWRKSLQSRTESSPIVHRGVVYFGTEGGVLHAVSARTGEPLWITRTHGAIKSSPALHRGVLFVGDYSGRMYAMSARNGRILWSNATAGAWLGLRGGTFYSTPAVAFGRVYAGNSDGKVYAFGARSGRIAWSHSTGGRVYSSPALATNPRTGPTVFIGSRDGRLYALDARRGSVKWTHRGGGRIIGSPSAIGSIVYYSDLIAKRTYGVRMSTGEEVFRHARGAYSPMITDGKRLYLTGWASITALEPRRSR